MNISQKSQKGQFLILVGRILTFLALTCSFSANAYTPEAEMVMEALRENISTGLVGSSAYAAFVSELEDEDGCETWAMNAPNQNFEVWKEMVDACPDLGSSNSQARSLQMRWSAKQSVQPRLSETEAPLLQSEAHNNHGGFLLSLHDLRPFERLAEARFGELTLQVGQIHSGLVATRVPFVVGSRFYVGWSGGSGISGPLASPQASLDGLAIAYHLQGWQAQAAGTWNRLLPRGTRIEPQRRDALLYLMGLSKHNLRFQIAHQRFEPTMGEHLSITIGGMSLASQDGRWQAGLATSERHPESDRFDPRIIATGAYGEFAFASPGNYRVEIRQAIKDWANPLQSPRSYLQDTLNGEWLLPGRGEGGLQAHSRLLIYRLGNYQMDLESGEETVWTLESRGLLTSEMRLALIQSYGPWTYSCGMGVRLLGDRSADAWDADEEGPIAIGHILVWQGVLWKARLSLIQQTRDYHGTYPNPLALTLDHRIKGKRGSNFHGEAFTGNVQEPANYLRVGLREEWELGGGLELRHGLRLPWSRTTGWANDLTYQVGMEAKLR